MSAAARGAADPRRRCLCVAVALALLAGGAAAQEPHWPAKAVKQFLYKSLPYDPVKDFAPVTVLKTNT